MKKKEEKKSCICALNITLNQLHIKPRPASQMQYMFLICISQVQVKLPSRIISCQSPHNYKTEFYMVAPATMII